LGEVPKDLVDHLVAYYRTEYDLGVRVLPTVSLEGLTWNRPGQMEAHYLESLYAKAYPLLYRDRNVILIGLTSLDIYTADQNWNWFFGHSGSGKALFSLYRMDPVNWGKRVNDDLRNKRVRTLMNKYVGLNYYNLPLSDNPRNVMYRLIGGLDTLDGIDERIPLRILPTPRPGTTIGTPLPTPTAIPQRLESIGQLIAMEYIEAIESTKAVVAIRGNTADIEDKLTQLRDSYKPSLAKLGCETDAMSVEERIGVFEAAVAYHDIHGNEDFDWFTEAVGSFGDDSGVGKLLHELNTISHYAMPNAYGEPRAFKTPCD
jgi:predicted Zn-dependent protease